MTENAGNDKTFWDKPLLKPGSSAIVYSFDQEGKKPLLLKEAIAHALVESNLSDSWDKKKLAYSLATKVVEGKITKLEQYESDLIRECVNAAYSSAGISGQIASLLGL